MPGFGRNNRERFLPLPVLASITFIALVAGQQYYGMAAVTEEAGTRYGRSPNVAEAWMEMQTPPSLDENDWILAWDRIAVISPIPGPGVESSTIYFMSMQGVPFTMQYISWLSGYYGDLRPGATVYAYFTYGGYEDSWHLVFVSATGSLF